MIGIVNVIAIGFILLMVLVLYCCMAINGKRNTNSGIHRFDDITIGECETAYKEKGFVTSINDGYITGFELEKEGIR